jgi:hypothetical protein
MLGHRREGSRQIARASTRPVEKRTPREQSSKSAGTLRAAAKDLGGP